MPATGQKTLSPRFAAQAHRHALSPGIWGRVQADALKHLGPYTPIDVPMYQRKLIRRDPQVSLGMQAIKTPFFGIDYRLEGGTPEINAFIRKAFLDTPLWHKWLNSALNALDFGHSPHEVVWRRGILEIDEDGPGGVPPKRFENAWLFEKLEDLDPELVELWVDDTRALIGVKWLDHPTELVDDRLLSTDDKAIVVTHDAEHQNWLGQSVLDRVYNAWYWWNWVHLYMVRYLERKASPPYKAWAPADDRYERDEALPGQDGTDAVELMGTLLSQLQGDGVVVFPFELDEATGKERYGVEPIEDSGRIDQFLPSLQHLGDLILRGLGVPERVVTQNSTVGSFAMVAAQADVFWASRQRDLLEILNATTEGPVAFLTRQNFGAAAPVPRVRASELSRQARETTAKMLELAWKQPYVTPEGKLYTAGMLFDPQRALEALNQPHAKAGQVARDGSDPFLARVMEPAGPAPEAAARAEPDADPLTPTSGGVADEAVPPQVGLNGAQITAAADLIEKVSTGILPAEAARELLTAMGIAEDRVDRMISATESFEATEIPGATTDETAMALGVSASTVRSWAKQGAPHQRVVGRLRFAPTAVGVWAREHGYAVQEAAT